MYNIILYYSRILDLLDFFSIPDVWTECMSQLFYHDNIPESAPAHSVPAAPPTVAMMRGDHGGDAGPLAGQHRCLALAKAARHAR